MKLSSNTNPFSWSHLKDSEDVKFSPRVIPSGTSGRQLSLSPKFDVYLELMEEFTHDLLSSDVVLQDNPMEDSSNADPIEMMKSWKIRRRARQMMEIQQF